MGPSKDPASPTLSMREHQKAHFPFTQEVSADLLKMVTSRLGPKEKYCRRPLIIVSFQDGLFARAFSYLQFCFLWFYQPIVHSGQKTHGKF